MISKVGVDWTRPIDGSRGLVAHNYMIVVIPAVFELTSFLLPLVRASLTFYSVVDGFSVDYFT